MADPSAADAGARACSRCGGNLVRDARDDSAPWCAMCGTLTEARAPTPVEAGEAGRRRRGSGADYRASRGRLATGARA